MHYILSPKPWDEADDREDKKNEITHGWWREANQKRLEEEKEKGIPIDGF